MKNNIKLSIITPTLNNGRDIKPFLKSIENQEFPRSKLEIIISDGGSIDNTISIAKKYKAKVIKNPHILADPGVNIGIESAKGEILMVLACDNIYKDRNALKKMVRVFDDKSISAAFPSHSSLKTDSIFTKYINNFTDPFNHFVYGYASNGRTFGKIYKKLFADKIYEVYDYTSSNNKPLIAIAQGFTVRRGFARSRKSRFDDVLPVIELISKKNRIAFVHSVKLYHHTVRDLSHFMKKQSWATINALQKKNYGIAHRVNYLSEKQKFRSKIWPIYALSLVFPITVAFYHLIKDREPLWILHPLLCMISAIASVYALFLYLFDRNYEFKR